LDTAVIATFHRVRVQYVGEFVHNYPPTALFRLDILLILGGHLPLREVALRVFEIAVVERHDPTERFGFNVLGEILEKVAVDEAALGRMVSVQVEVEHDAGAELLYHVLHCEYRWSM